jgi:hypothetical protein
MLSEISQNEKLYNIFHNITNDLQMMSPNITNDLQTTSPNITNNLQMMSQNATSLAVYYINLKARAIESQLGLTDGR